MGGTPKNQHLTNELAGQLLGNRENRHRVHTHLLVLMIRQKQMKGEVQRKHLYVISNKNRRWPSQPPDRPTAAYIHVYIYIY